MAEIDKKLLAGLTYRDAERKEVVQEGRRVVVSTPRERPLRPADVLSWRDAGDGTVVLVAADGRKHTVATAAEKK